ncbi:MAG: S41 family peptidase [Eubacteriales bacterium]|nr:S41 family peptidase [Eubacteriales bacterium]
MDEMNDTNIDEQIENSTKEEKAISRSIRQSMILSFLLGAVFSLLVLAIAVMVYLRIPSGKAPSSPTSASAIRKAIWIQELIDENYLNEADGRTEADAMYLGMLHGLGDDYADYYTAEEYTNVQMSHNGQMEGIGVTITMDEESGYILVKAVSADSPAEGAGVQIGDLITKINGEDTASITTTEAVSMIQKKEDKTVVLTIRRGDEELELTMERTAINRNVVIGTVVEEKYGYIMISTFNRLTPEQFKTAYEDLQKQNIEGLIIDLRGNLGGLVDACCDTLNQFMPEGPLVYEKDKDGEEKQRDCTGESPIDIPLVVLVNGSSASASEIFAGAVQDYEVGTLVGTTTYGKGVEQNSFILPDGSVIKMTTKNYYSPKKRNINGVGLTPDVEIELPEDAETDVQLEKALKILEGKVS